MVMCIVKTINQAGVIPNARRQERRWKCLALGWRDRGGLGEEAPFASRAK